MKNKKDKHNNSDYKIVMSELGSNPFRIVNAAFALMGIIPLLILFYIVIGKNLWKSLFIGNNGLAALMAVVISSTGFLYAYSVVNSMVKKLLSYSVERKRADEEKTELIQAVSHDLKTPLAVVKTGIQNLLDGVGGGISKIQT